MLQLPHAHLTASASLFFLLHRLLEACDSSVIPADSCSYDIKSKEGMQGQRKKSTMPYERQRTIRRAL